MDEMVVFEASNEVTNYQGGIGSLQASKADRISEHYDSRHVYFGPYFGEEVGEQDQISRFSCFFCLNIIFYFCL
jgi:hypothetical protein